MNTTPLTTQIGGDHYKGFAIQPVEYIHQNNLGFLVGCIIKRICRFNRPGGKGLEDLRKISHEIDLLIDQHNKGFIGLGSLKPRPLMIYPKLFCEINGLGYEQFTLIELVTQYDRGIDNELLQAKQLVLDIIAAFQRSNWIPVLLEKRVQS